MCIVRFLVLILVIIGSLNWGLWGLFKYDFVADLLGGRTAGLARLIYSIVGFAGLYAISFLFVPEIYKGKCKCSIKKEEHKEEEEEHKEE